VVQGRITISKAGVSPTHPPRNDTVDTGATRHRVNAATGTVIGG